MTETNQLLRDYVCNGSETAFRDLVGRYMNLVYSVAVRRVGGDAHLAQDVAQTVFTDLAGKARLLPSNVTLGGWLHRHTCFVSSSLLRAERRWQTREREAVEMNSLQNSPDTVWMQLAPMLDEAIDQLGAPDREAILLRYFEQRDLRSVGAALGISEDAAQKRVTRAVEKLREIVSRQGVTLSATLLAGALTANAVSAAPAGLVSSVSAAALAAAVAGASVTGGLLQLLAAAKFKLALAAGIIAVISLPLILRQAGQNDARDNQRETVSQAVDPTRIPAQSAEIPAPALALAGNSSTNKTVVESGLLKLTILAADSGKPVPIVQIDYRRWEGGKFQGRTLQATRFGVCEVSFPAETTTDLQLTTRMDDFADTRLQWRMDHGEQIPTNYTLRLTRPVPIGGKVVDADGQPVAGAKVGWNHKTDVDAVDVETRPESHAFSWIEVETDAEGRWRINRIAPEMIRLLYGGARHPEHIDTGFTLTAEAEKQLLAEKHVFRLGRALSIRGIVLDTEGQPVEGASVLLGQRGMSDRRETKSTGDGTFDLPGCKPGKNLLSAEAKGFAATTLEVEVTADSEPFQLTLQRGRILRLRVVNQADQPVSKAYVWLNTFDRRSNFGQPASPAPVQADFSPRTDADGKVVWSNAPAAEMSFDVQASGYMRVNGVKIQADGEEHVIKMPPALVVSGTVRDAATGELVPRFRIGTGWPSLNSDGTMGTRWSTIDRFWISFAGGKFRHSYEEAVIGGTDNRGYILKFEAEGYAPFVSRVIGADEGEVTLDVTLKAASTVAVTVLLPDGSPAIGVDVGLVSPGAGLNLRPGGFSRQNVQSGGSLRATDGEGKFQLPPDETINRVIAACPSGYVEVPRAILAGNPIMQLQPWGRIEGTYLSGGLPAADREFWLQDGPAGTSGVAFDLLGFKVSTDKEGRFVFPQVPPGTFKFVRLVPLKMGPGQGGWSHAPLQDVEVRPGETTMVTVGGSGYTVTAHLRWPADLNPESSSHIMASINTPLPPSLAAMRKNPEVAAKWQQTPEFQEFSRNARRFTAAVGGDGTLTAENVPPGEYELTVFAILGRNGGDKLSGSANGAVKLSVPAEPPNGSLDAGEILLRKAENPR